MRRLLVQAAMESIQARRSAPTHSALAPFLPSCFSELRLDGLDHRHCILAHVTALHVVLHRIGCDQVHVHPAQPRSQARFVSKMIQCEACDSWIAHRKASSDL